MGVTYVLTLLTQLLALVPQGSALFAQFTAQKQQAQDWAASGHVPTDAEWDALDAQVKALEAQIDAGAQ